MADYPAVYELWAHSEGICISATDDTPESIARFLARNPTTCFAAEVQGALVGVILAGHDGRRGFLYHMVVAPGARRQGVGKQLVEAALAALQAEGIRKVALLVLNQNAGGNAFWERCGFEARPDLTYRNLEFATAPDACGGSAVSGSCGCGWVAADRCPKTTC